MPFMVRVCDDFPQRDNHPVPGPGAVPGVVARRRQRRCRTGGEGESRRRLPPRLPGRTAAPVGKPPAALEGDEVLVSAERLERSNQERIVIGEGAVTIRHRDMRLVADRVVYSELTKGVIADGNVVLDSGSDRLQGEHLELNLDTRIGFLEHAQGFIQTYYFTGSGSRSAAPTTISSAAAPSPPAKGFCPTGAFMPLPPMSPSRNTCTPGTRPCGSGSCRCCTSPTRSSRSNASDRPVC